MEEKQKYIFEAFLDADRQAAVLQCRPSEPQNLQDFGKLAACSSLTRMVSANAATTVHKGISSTCTVHCLML